MATHEEHRAYIKGLLAKEDKNTINDAEKNALMTYRIWDVRDAAGGLVVEGRRVRVLDSRWYARRHIAIGALFVRPSAWCYHGESLSFLYLVGRGSTRADS